MSTTMPVDVTRLAPSARARGPTALPIRAREPLAAARAVESVGITVADLDRAVRFYTEVLSFAEVGTTFSDDPALETLNDLPAP
jgi:catechol-2,3-dioxygenase